MKTVLLSRDVKKSYHEGPVPVEVLKGVNLEVKAGERLAIVGASGSGKSTLLNVLGGLDTPDAGDVEVLGAAFSSCGEAKRGRIRNQSLGFVYQFHHLLPEFTALENVAMPQLIAKNNKTEATAAAKALLGRVGLDKRLDHKPAELSGGERQRVAIARALANEPECVLMDEPTGNLDSKNAGSIQTLMLDLAQDVKTSFIVVTHDEHLADQMDRVYELVDGVLSEKSV